MVVGAKKTIILNQSQRAIGDGSINTSGASKIIKIEGLEVT
jgi:hypothetical protein